MSSFISDFAKKKDQEIHSKRKMSAAVEQVAVDPEVLAEAQFKETHPDVPAARVRTRTNSKEAEGAAAAPPNGVVSVPRSQKNRRQPRTAKGRGEAKKDGGGGKFTWGLAGKVYEEPAYLDPDDPNYDSDNQGAVTLDSFGSDSEGVTASKTQLEVILTEYFLSDDVKEAIALLREAALPESSRSTLVRSAVRLAADRPASCRELASELLAELVGRRVLYPADVARGFLGLLNSDLPDLRIDFPLAPQTVGNFMARAVADLALGSEFVETLQRTRETALSNPGAVEAVERAAALADQRGLLHDIWGVGGAFKPVRFLSRQMQLLLQEFLGSGDVAEARACLRELEVPHFHHELVYQAGVQSLEAMHETVLGQLSGLLRALAASGDLSSDCLDQGFRRLFAGLEELSLDLPPAYTLAELWTKACKDFLPPDVLKSLPHKGRKRFVSESGNGRLKVIDVAHPLI